MTKRIRVQSVSALGAAALVLILQACGGGNGPATAGSAGSMGTGNTSGAAGTVGQAGTQGQAGDSGAAGTTGAGGSATGAGGAFSPSCTGLVTAGGMEPAKGVACVAADVQLCYKTCGPEKQGAKSETCTGGVYAEMSGCSFDSATNFACYKIPAAANTMCPAGVTPQASQDCTVDMCVLCNSTGGLPGGHYNDSGGADKMGYCVCQAANSAGKRTWSCASDTAWPCPAGLGC